MAEPAHVSPPRLRQKSGPRRMEVARPRQRETKRVSHAGGRRTSRVVWRERVGPLGCEKEGGGRESGAVLSVLSVVAREVSVEMSL